MPDPNTAAARGPSGSAALPDDLAVVIMAGGAGTRFWPLSTEARPKQFLALLSENSLLQESYARARLLAPPERILVLTSRSLVAEVQRDLPDLPAANVIGEPVRRDTAAAVALAALLLRRRFGDPVMVVLTADHHIEPAERFGQAVASAARAARSEEALYTFGIPPTHVATGYGYLELGEEVTPPQPDPAIEHRVVRAFREKPDLATAEGFVRAGTFIWNSGMFVWTVSVILSELSRSLPDHVEILAPVAAQEGADGWATALAEAFTRLTSVSIDRGVMERARRVHTVIAPFSWNDVGGWQALEEFLPDDGRGNRHRGQVTVLDATGNLAFNEDPDELIALVGVRDLVVVRAGKRTLVADRAHCEDIKELVQALERHGQGRHT